MSGSLRDLSHQLEQVGSAEPTRRDALSQLDQALEHVREELRAASAALRALGDTEQTNPADETARRHFTRGRIDARIRPGEGDVEPIDDEHCVLRAQSDVLEWILFMLIWLSFDFEVHEPVEMLDYVTGLTERLSRSVPA
jgi:hypothetical protein